MRRKWTIAYLKEVLYRKRSRRALKNQSFTIISNNCWAGEIYESLNQPYRTPTVGLFFYAPCYVRFISDLKGMLEESLHFISISKYETANRYRKENSNYYPIATLGKEGPEIHFLHFDTNSEAEEKWKRRAERVNLDNLFFKFCDRDLFEETHLEVFEKIEAPKVFFSSKKRPKIPFAVFLKKYQNNSCVGDLYSNPWDYRPYFNVVRWLNKS